MPGANAGKALTIEVDGSSFARIPIRTHVVMHGDELDPFVRQYAEGVVQPGDILFVTEKIVAITQGRSYPIESIEPRRLARFLSRFVVRTPHGIGLGMPETMEMALRECGTLRILFAAAVSAVTKLFGRKGDFYRVAGDRARAIDGPTEGTIPPYDRSVVLGPERPREVAAHLKSLVGGHADDRLPVEEHAAAAWLHQADDAAQRGRLADAVAADQPEEAGGVGVQAHPVQHRGGAVGGAQVADFKQAGAP